MNSNMKRFASLMLVLVMVFSLLPTNLQVFAADEPQPQEIGQDAYAEVDTVFDLIDKAESAPAKKNATDAQKVEDAIAIVLASDSYVEGSLEQNGNFFTWETDDGIRCAYSPRMREIDDKRTPETSKDVIVNEPVATKGGSPAGNQVYLIGPYYGSDSSFTDQYKKEAKRVAETIGDTDGYTLYSGKAATVDKVAEAISNGAVVFFDSHGMTNYENPNNEYDCSTKATMSYLCLTSTTGLTDEDYDDGALYYPDGICINGATIANHMTKNSPSGFLWMAICLGMATDTMCQPLRAKGVEVVYGYSESVTFEGDYRFEKAFWDAFLNGDTVANAISKMKAKWGNYDWSTQIANDYGSYDGYTSLREAQDDFTAFPVVVSDEDPHPGKRTTSSYGASALQTVKSTYVLFTPCDHVWTSATCTAAATCTLCGRTNGKPLPHSDGNGDILCDVCGADMSVTPNTYVKVTETPDDWSGQYLIVYEAGGLALNGALTSFDVVNNGFDVTIEDNTIVLDDADADKYFVVAPYNDRYSVQSASGYYIGNTSYSNRLQCSKNADYLNNLALNADGSAVIEADDSSVLRFNMNEGQDRFRFYKSGQEPVALYKLQEGSTSGGGSAPCSHSYDNGVVTTQPTCSSDGVITYTCTLCGNKETNSVPALGHSWVAATCTTPKTCSVCKTTEGSVASHADTNSDGKCDACGTSMGVVTPPVGAAGSYVLVTSKDQLTTGQYVMIADHNYAPGVYSDGWLTAVQPIVSGDTVTDTKGAVWTLTFNGSSVTLTDSKGVTVKPKSGNNNGIVNGTYNWAWAFNDSTGTVKFMGVGSDTTTLASNKGSGNQFRSYKNTTAGGSGYPCNFKLYKLVEHTHSYVGAVTTEPTCTTAGVKTFTCSCGDKYTETIAALGHSYKVVVVEPTCTLMGTITSTCSTCGDSHIDAITPLDHDYQAAVTAPTCTEDGYTTYTCSACGDSYTADKVNALGHTYVDGSCTTCGAADPDAPTGPVQVDELNFQKIAFNLSGYIGLQFAISNSAAANYDEVYVKVEMDLYNADGVAERKVYELREGQTAGSYLVFIHGVAPKLMGRVMHIQTIAVKDGVEYCGAAQDYSIKQGIIDRLTADKGKTDAKSVNRSILMVDMLFYGAEAQKRFEQVQYDGLVTEDPNVAEFLSLRTADPQAVTATNTTAQNKTNELYGYALGLSDAVELQVTFTLEAGMHEAYTIQIKCAGEVYTYEYADFQFVYAKYPNRATIICSKLAAKQMRDVAEIVLLKNGEQVSETYFASIEGCAQPTVANATHKNNALVKAMMAYGDSAKVYFG